jgi:quinol monooxygenase YgiN
MTVLAQSLPALTHLTPANAQLCAAVVRWRGLKENTMVSHGLLARLKAQSSRIVETEQFLDSALPQVRQEPGTKCWFSFRIGRGEYGMFDAFVGEGGRIAHLEGPVANSLMARAPNLLEKLPEIEMVEIVAGKIPEALAPRAATCGLLLSFNAKAGNEANVEQFLRDALPLVQDEAGTLAWFGLRWPATRRYGIFDVFPDHTARLKHIAGRVPRELTRHALTLLGGMPRMDMLDVLASHVAERETLVGLGVD